MQRLHHQFEFLDVPDAFVLTRRVTIVRSKKTDRAVTPVIVEAPLDQMHIMHELLNGHQLDGGDAKALEIADNCRLRQTQIGASKLGRNVGMLDGEAFDMSFVDHCHVPRRANRLVIAPVETGSDDSTPGDVWRRIEIVADTVRPPEVLTEDSFVPLHLSLNAPCIWIEQEFRRVASKSRGRFPRPVHSKPILLSRPKVRKVSVPTERSHFGKVIPRLSPGIIEETKLDTIRDARKEREVHSESVVDGAKRIWFAAARSHEQRCADRWPGSVALVKLPGNARSCPDDRRNGRPCARTDKYRLAVQALFLRAGVRRCSTDVGVCHPQRRFLTG